MFPQTVCFQTSPIIVHNGLQWLINQAGQVHQYLLDQLTVCTNIINNCRHAAMTEAVAIGNQLGYRMFIFTLFTVIMFLQSRHQCGSPAFLKKRADYPAHGYPLPYGYVSPKGLKQAPVEILIKRSLLKVLRNPYTAQVRKYFFNEVDCLICCCVLPAYINLNQHLLYGQRNRPGKFGDSVRIFK